MDQSLANLSSTQKDELMEQVKQQIAIANTQEIITVRPMFTCNFILVTSFVRNLIKLCFILYFTENNGEMF